jgi:hypothetical protein
MTPSIDRPWVPGLYRVSAPDGADEELVRVEPGPRGLVCIPDDRTIPPVLVAAIPPGALRWRRES